MALVAAGGRAKYRSAVITAKLFPNFANSLIRQDNSPEQHESEVHIVNIGCCQQMAAAAAANGSSRDDQQQEQAAVKQQELKFGKWSPASRQSERRPAGFHQYPLAAH